MSPVRSGPARLVLDPERRLVIRHRCRGGRPEAVPAFARRRTQDVPRLGFEIVEAVARPRPRPRHREEYTHARHPDVPALRDPVPVAGHARKRRYPRPALAVATVIPCYGFMVRDVAKRLVGAPGRADRVPLTCAAFPGCLGTPHEHSTDRHGNHSPDQSKGEADAVGVLSDQQDPIDQGPTRARDLPRPGSALARRHSASVKSSRAVGTASPYLLARKTSVER